MSKAVRAITVNQIGYLTSASKLASFTDSAGIFKVVSEQTGEIIFRGETSEIIFDEVS